jgi:hypothetical protein
MAKTLTEYIIEKASQKRDDAKKTDGKKTRSTRKAKSGTLTEFLLNRRKSDKEKSKNKNKQQSQISFAESLNQSFTTLSRKTEKIKSLVHTQVKLLEEQTEQETIFSENISILSDLFTQRAELEKQVFLSVAHKYSDFPKEIPEYKEPSINPTEDTNTSVEESPDNNITPPPLLNTPQSPDKKAEGGVAPGKSKKTKVQSLAPYADVMQLPMQAAGIASVNLVSELLRKSGPLGGFFVPYIKSLVTPFAVAMGVGESVISSLLGGSARAATLEMNASQKDFAKTWRSFLGDENFILKFIDRTLTGGTDGEVVDPGDFTGNATEKAAKIAKMLMKDLGYKDFQAAAIVGNLTQENTNLIPDLLEGSKKGLLPTAMKKGIGYGWAQWTDPGRQQELYNLAKSMGVDPEKQPLTDAVNYAMLKQEFPKYDSGGRFKASTTIEQASNWVLMQYERPADQGPREQAERIADSKAVLAKISAARGTSVGNSKKILNTYIVDGPESGFDSNIQGLPVTLHGKEIVRVFDGGFEVYPLENKEYSIKEDPMGVMERWSEIASGLEAKVASLFASGGVSEGVKAIQHDEALSSLSRGKNDYIVKNGKSIVSSTPWSKISTSTPLHAYETGVSGDRTTIGWGMTYYDSITAGRKAVKPGDTITKAKADSLLTGLVNNYVKTLSGQKWYQKYWNKMSSKQQAGLLAYGYNQPAHLLGTGAPKMYAALSRGDMNAVAANIDRGLPAREKNEKALVLSGPRNLNTATASKPDKKVVVNNVGGGGSSPSVTRSSSKPTQSTSYSFNPLRFLRELTMQRTR